MKHWILAILYALVIPGIIFWFLPGLMLAVAYICLAGVMILVTLGVAANLLMTAEDRALQEHVRSKEE